MARNKGSESASMDALGALTDIERSGLEEAINRLPNGPKTKLIEAIGAVCADAMSDETVAFFAELAEGRFSAEITARLRGKVHPKAYDTFLQEAKVALEAKAPQPEEGSFYVPYQPEAPVIDVLPIVRAMRVAMARGSKSGNDTREVVETAQTSENVPADTTATDDEPFDSFGPFEEALAETECPRVRLRVLSALTSGSTDAEIAAEFRRIRGTLPSRNPQVGGFLQGLRARLEAALAIPASQE